MKNFVIFGLLGFVGVAWWRSRTAIGKPFLGGMLSGPVSASGDVTPLGVSIYDTQAAPQRAAQVYASLSTNPDAVSDPGFAPAFGADENQPASGWFWSES